MQTFFGALGTRPDAERTFGRIDSSIGWSWPRATIQRVDGSDAAAAMIVASTSRSFAHWRSDDATLEIALDGRIDVAGETHLRGAAAARLETVGALYRRAPERFWELLDGSFCLVVRDGDSFEMGVDPAGARSVYWSIAGGSLGFASHLLDAVAAGMSDLSCDMGAIGTFLASGSYPPSRTPFRGLAHLGAGQRLTFAHGRVLAVNHFALVSDPNAALDESRAAQELEARVAEAVASAVSAADRPVFPLSGGVDSRYLVAEAVRHTDRTRDLKTITWGVDRTRPDADGVIAEAVAKRLGIEHAWHDKPQRPSYQAFERAVLLSSGEADCAIHYPEDHVLHERLAAEFGSLFRGDECFGDGPSLLTRRAAFPANGILRLRLDPHYPALIDPDALSAMVAEQEAILAEAADALKSPTATGCRDEVFYAWRTRRVLAAYNRVKLADLEVFTPFLDRAVLDVMRRVPDALRRDKLLVRRNVSTRFPNLADIPFARRSNLDDWSERFATDRELAAVYQEAAAGSGWLDEVGAGASVRRMLDRLGRRVGPDASRGEDSPRSWRGLLKQTLPGRLLRELAMDRRNPAATPTYLRLARLTVVHMVIGGARQRRRSASAVVADP